MIVGSILLIHALIAFFGIRSFWKQKKLKESLLFAAGLGISAYAAVAKPASLPPLSIPNWIGLVFAPLGAWVERALGGPFG